MKDNTPHKIRELWKNVNRNEINVNDLKKRGIKFSSILYSKTIYTYETAWASWLDLATYPILTIEELKDFPDNFIPFIESNLITKTIEDSKDVPNEEYIEDFTDRILSLHYGVHYTYTIKAEEITDSESAQAYKDKNGEYPIKYYLISYVSLWFHNSQAGDNRINYPLHYKQLITINNPKIDEIRTNKS